VTRCLASLVFVLAVIGSAHAQSETALAGMQAYNRGDVATAFRLLRQAADAGDSEAQVNLGYLYARGHGVREDQAEALRLYELAAKAGSSEGMNAIGYKYLWGTGVKRDPKQAAYWFCESVVRGNPRAMNNLALMLATGEPHHDEPEARNLWEQAAKLGHVNAMNNLGLSYVNGRERNLQKADEWMTRAAQAGHPNAQRYLRSRGVMGPFPRPVNVGNVMTPAPKNVVGHTKECGLYIA
jgi:TPR repeat protein